MLSFGNYYCGVTACGSISFINTATLADFFTSSIRFPLSYPQSPTCNRIAVMDYSFGKISVDDASLVFGYDAANAPWSTLTKYPNVTSCARLCK